MKITKQSKGSNVLLAVAGTEREQTDFINSLHSWGVTRKERNGLENDGERVYLWAKEERILSGLTNKTICNLPDATLAQFKTKRYGAWKLARSIALDTFHSWGEENLTYFGGKDRAENF